MFSKKLHIIMAIICAGSLITVFASSNAVAGPLIYEEPRQCRQQQRRFRQPRVS